MPRGSRGGSRSSPFGSKRHSSNSAAPQAKPQQQSVPPKPSQTGSGLGASMARGAAFGVGAGVAGEAVRGMMGTSRYGVALLELLNSGEAFESFQFISGQFIFDLMNL